MKKFFRALLWILLTVIILGTFYFLYQNSRPKEDQFDTLTPSTGSISRTTVLAGKIEPRDEIEIKPQISGIISEIMVEAGDMVREGDIIARIKVIPDASSLSSAQSRINSAQIDLGDAAVKWQRDSMLYARKVIAREEMENTRKTYDKARQELEAARDVYRIVREGVSQYNASESNTMVRATITGLILDVPVKVGSSVIQANTMNDGTTIATIADMNNLIFKGNVDETEVGLLHVGLPMDISIGALPDVHPAGVIEYIAPKGKEDSGANSFEIKAALTFDSITALRAGYSANATVTLAEVKDVLTVPESAVEFRGDSAFVYVRTDSLPKPVYERRAVSTGMSDGISIEIKNGIDSTAVLRGAKL